MPSNGISGIRGDVLTGTGTPVQVAEVTKWNFNPKSNNVAWHSNRTGGYTARAAGNRDGSGTVEGKWSPITADMVLPALKEGANVTLNLQIISTQKYVVPAIIDGFKIGVDLDTGEAVGWSADFSTNGAWTDPVGVSAIPSTWPTLLPQGMGEAAPEEPAFAQAARQATRPIGAPAPRAQEAPRAAFQGGGQPQGVSRDEVAQIVAETLNQAILTHPLFQQLAQMLGQTQGGQNFGAQTRTASPLAA
jgi:hypothetical protein